MNDAREFPVKKAFLYSFILSIVLSAILGIVAILSGSWGWLEVRVLLTTVTVAGASICGLGSGAYLATGRGRVLPLAGIALAVAGGAMVIAGIWLEPPSTAYWKLAASLSVFAIATGHLALLCMARLATSFAWSIAAARVIIFGVALLIVGLMFLESSDAGMFRLLGVAAIIDAAITLLVPIFHWLSRARLAPAGDGLVEEAAIEREIARLRERIGELEARLRRA